MISVFYHARFDKGNCGEYFTYKYLRDDEGIGYLILGYAAPRKDDYVHYVR